MFKKVLIANRGEIAVRIVRTCRDMGLRAIALYDESDRNSLHVRLADECVLLQSPRNYMDDQAILQLALDCDADAIHPGYGFVAERPDFIRACEEAGITFIGPSSRMVRTLQDKIGTLNRVREAGFRTTVHSTASFGETDVEAIEEEGARLGYPLIIKSCSGGRGRGTYFVSTPAQLLDVTRRAYSEAQAIYGTTRLFLEKAIQPARQLAVQIAADHQGRIIHLGERDSSLLLGNQKLIMETPAPYLSAEARRALWQDAIAIARLLDYRNVGSVEFLLDAEGRWYFTEIKPRIQVEHPVTEMVAQVDLVGLQFRLAAGEPLPFDQESIRLNGWAMSCRINAQDPWENFLPSPGRLGRYRLPSGPHVRVDTYGYSGCDVPVRYDPILAKVSVWGEDRAACIRRLGRALEEFAVNGVKTNLPLHQQIVTHSVFGAGEHTTAFNPRQLLTESVTSPDLRDLAVAVAVAYVRRNQAFQPSIPDRLRSGWHQSRRRLRE